MPFTDGRITSRQICVGAVTERTIAPSAVSGDKIADGAITINLFDNGVQPVQYVAVLPLDNSGGDLAFLTTNGKLYRWSGGAWTVAVDGTDIVAGSIVASDKIAANTITAGQIAANTITAGEIAAAAISTDELDANAVTAAKLAAMNIEVGKYIRSTTYVPGTSGWNIHADGTAEFQSATIRGTLNASDISAGTLSVARIGSNTIDMSKIELTAALETNQEIRSSTYTAGSAGWQIKADGNAEFNNVTVRGTIYATSGQIGGLSIVNTLTFATGGIFRTAASGTRIELSTGNPAQLFWYRDAETTATAPSVSRTSSQMWFGGGSTGYPTIILYPADEVPAGGYVPYRILLGGSGLNTTIGGILAIQSGSVSAPSLAFTADSNTGMYRVGADQLGFSAGGTLRAVLDGSRFGIMDGSVGIPAHSFISDSDTGMYRISANTLGFSVGNSLGLNLGPGADKYIYGLTTGTTNAMHWNSSTSQITYVVSSRKVKRNITTLRDTGLTDLLRPVRYRMRKNKTVDDPELWRLGLIAEEVADVDERFTPGSTDNYDDRAVLAAVIKDLQDARGRIAVLETR